jgi:hypothetical protein
VAEVHNIYCIQKPLKIYRKNKIGTARKEYLGQNSRTSLDRTAKTVQRGKHCYERTIRIVTHERIARTGRSRTLVKYLIK